MLPYDELKAKCEELSRKLDLVLLLKQDMLDQWSNFILLSEQSKAMQHDMEISINGIKSMAAPMKELMETSNALMGQLREV